MFVRDGAPCYHGGTPDGRLRWARGMCTRSREPPDRCERVVRTSAVTAARTGEAAIWGKIWFFGPFGAASRLRHATRRLMRGNSARRTTPAYATGVGRALSARATPPGVVRVPRGGASGVRMGANFGGMLGNFDRLVRVPGKLTSRLRKFPGNFTLAGPFILLVLYTF